MRRLEKFLFYYSILATTVLFFGTVFFSPSPLNLLSLFFLVPLIAYFWIRMTSPQEVQFNAWSLRVVLVILFLSGLSILAFSLGKAPKGDVEQTAVVESDKNEAPEDLATKALLEKIEALSEKDSNEELAQELAAIRRELARISGKEISSESGVGGTSLGSSTGVEGISENLEDIPYGFVSIKSSTVEEVDVLDNPTFSASRVGVMKKGETYEFFEKDGGWYLITLPDGTQGWVNQRDVEEEYQTSNP